jgi:hypothetical protein
MAMTTNFFLKTDKVFFSETFDIYLRVCAALQPRIRTFNGLCILTKDMRQKNDGCYVMLCYVMLCYVTPSQVPARS